MGEVIRTRQSLLARRLLGCDEPDRPFRRIGRGHEGPQGGEHLLELGAGGVCEGIMSGYQRIGFFLHLVQPACQIGHGR